MPRRRIDVVAACAGSASKKPTAAARSVKTNATAARKSCRSSQVVQASVPFMTGTTATEVTFFAPDDQLRPIDDATSMVDIQ